MSGDVVRKRGQRQWSEAQRRAVGERNQLYKPWLKSTGPKTDAGKKRASLNAYKHGRKAAVTLRFSRLLKRQKAFSETFRSWERNLNDYAGFPIRRYHIYKALNFKEFYGFKDDFGPRRAGA